MAGWQNHPFGIEVKAGDIKAFCMCGKAGTGPFCDGSHSGTGITPKVVKFDADKTIHACGCLESKARPYCDGSHASLV